MGKLEKEPFKLRYRVDFEVKRYVDDYFVFSNDEKTLDLILNVFKKEIESYKLYINKAKTRKRKTPFIATLYHMYVYILCSFSESLLRTTYDSVLSKDWNEIRDPQLLNLIEQAQKRLKGLSWENLKREDKTYLGVELPKDLRESESLIAVNVLFKLRNLLIHGNNFEKVIMIDYPSNDSRYAITGKGEGVYMFLIEKKLMRSEEIEKLGYYELNSETIFYFISQIISFTKLYTEFLQTITGKDYKEYYSQIGLFDERHKILKK